MSMPFSPCLSKAPSSSCRFRMFVLLALLFCLGAGSGRADLVILKDGFLLHGQIKRDEQVMHDPFAGAVWMAKLDGFYWVNDRARRVAFSANQVVDATKQETIQDVEAIRPGRVNGRGRMGPSWQVDEVQEFNAHWERDIKLRTPQDQVVRITQRITELTPHHLRLEALVYNWTAYYLTREFTPDNIRFLLTTYLNRMRDKGLLKISPFDQALHVFRFLLQAGWVDEADRELEALQAKFPAEKKRIEANRDVLRKLQGMRLADSIERAYRAGQYLRLHSMLDRFHREKIDSDLIGEHKLGSVMVIQKKLADAEENVKQARRFLKELPGQVSNFANRAVLKEAAQLILDNLNADTVARLEGFVGQALQAERDRKKVRTPSNTPEQLLALAVSGWVMGNDAAEAQVDWALKLWEARAFALLYQKTTDEGDRRKMRVAYLQKSFIPLDELTQLIRFLPPAGVDDPVKAPKGKGTNLGIREIKMQGIGKGTSYFVQLPPEYHANRNYPVLVVLHEGAGDGQGMARRWSDLASKHGYILVAPDWGGGVNTTFQYTRPEHEIVLATLRDLRRRFAVDTDRVFLFGYEEGGKMAYDVGLSHPDLFAGVIPMAARPHWHDLHYWSNAQYLPFYVVDGTSDGTNPKSNREQFKKWVNRAYPAIYVEYMGRGPEWFSGELPIIFEWMAPKKRAHPLLVLGRDEFATMRESDNRFYWLGTDEIRDGCLNEAGRAWKNTRKPAHISASVGAATNTIFVNTFGVKQFTIWFPPGLVNFSNPVAVRVNGAAVGKAQRVAPSLDVMLEDFYRRGDRLQLVLAERKFVVK